MTGRPLRSAGPADLEHLVRLTRAFYDEDGFTTPTPQIRRNLEALLASEDARIAVAHGTGGAAPVGFALTTIRLILESGLVAELQDLYVVPPERRRGVASALIADSAQWAADRGARLLEVVVAPNGREVGHLFDFYAARGFADEGRRILARRLPEG
jgi:aminoglycoside 6'-N-acetyltransferase I